MGITGFYQTHKSIKGLKSMSTILKTPDLEENCFDFESFRKSLNGFKTADIEVLLDWYNMYSGNTFKHQIRALQDELELRNTLLWKELE